jgi:signal transduction histidine kinase
VRGRLSLTTLAVTSLVVLAFLVPLGVLVRDLAHDRALNAAETDAESIARFIAVIGPSRGVDQAVAALGGGDSDFGISVVLADRTVLGADLRPGEDPTTAAASGNTVRAAVDGGESVYVPILQGDGSLVVVRVFVPTEVIEEGVARSWVILAMLGIILIGVAVAVADRLAKSIVEPVQRLSVVATELGQGNLDARVDPSGPREIKDVGHEFNLLAERIEQLLQAERETAADLSHQLRTPLFVLRLDAEALPAGSGRDRILDDIDELSRHVDFVIKESRREVHRIPGVTSDLAAVLIDRASFWGALAEEQDRNLAMDLVPGPTLVEISSGDLQTMIDALIENVFAHTPEGAALAIELSETDGMASLTIHDSGPGFTDESVVARGTTGRDGTGLGLDIARRTAESAGGSLTLGDSDRLGGAAVVATFPIAGDR